MQKSSSIAYKKIFEITQHLFHYFNTCFKKKEERIPIIEKNSAYTNHKQAKNTKYQCIHSLQALSLMNKHLGKKSK